MPDYPHIERYRADLQELIEFGGSDSELNIRPAFQNCLAAYCTDHREKLALVPELRVGGCEGIVSTFLTTTLLLLCIVRFYKKHNVGSSQMQNVRCKVLRDFYGISALTMGTLPRLVSYSWYATFQYRA